MPSKDLPGRSQVERGFFKSLSHLKKYYGIQLDNYRTLPYPYNVLMAKYHAAKALRVTGRSRELFVAELDTNTVCLSVTESFHRDYGLYYIPVIPVYRLWQDEQHHATAELLTAVFAWLYVEAGLSYYRDDDTYMYFNYEILEDWILEAQDDEPDSFKAQYACYEEALHAGDFIQEKIMDGWQSEQLKELIDGFRPETDYQHEALAVAREAMQLSLDYPGANLFQHAREVQESDDDYYYNSTIFMHEYVGFVGSANDALSENLFSMIENDFNERSASQEPEIRTHFNEPQGDYKNELAYEERVFALIDEMCALLYQKP